MRVFLKKEIQSLVCVFFLKKEIQSLVCYVLHFRNIILKKRAQEWKTGKVLSSLAILVVHSKYFGLTIWA